MARPRRVAIALELSWPYEWHHGVYVGAQRYAKEQNWEAVIDEFLDNPTRYDGVIARATPEFVDLLAKHRTPFVNVKFSSPLRDSVPSVLPDFAACGRMQAEHLLERGYYNFAGLGTQNPGAQVALAEFSRVVSEAGHACLTAKVPTTFPSEQVDWEKANAILDQWMDRWQLPVGVGLEPALTSRVLVQKCRVRGLRIPEDVGIICGENNSTICEQPEPSITSVNIGFNRVGYQAAKLLDQLMHERRNRTKKKTTASPPQILVQPTGIVVRESSDIYNVSDELVAMALKYISSNIDRRIGPEDVARSVSIGARALQNRFHKILNRPIGKVIRQIRMDRAKRALLQDDKSMSAIAQEVGFIQPERMNEVFRRELGMSPTAFRKSRS